MTFFYVHNRSYLSLSSSSWLLQTSEKFWIRPVFLWPHGNIFLWLWVWEAGQEQPSANKTAFGVRGWRKWLSDFPHICKISLWAFFCSLFGFQLPYLHGSKKFLDQPSRMWVTLFSSGDRLLLFQVTCAWASPEMRAGYWKGHDYLLLKSALTVTRSEQISLQRFQEPRSSIAHLKDFKSLCREQLNIVWTQI